MAARFGSVQHRCSAQQFSTKDLGMRDLRSAIRNQPPVEHNFYSDPVQIPGAVQAYGVLLVAEAASRRIIFVSENVTAILGLQPADVLQKTYTSLVDAAGERKQLQEKIGPETILFPNPVRLIINGRAVDAVFHAQGRDHLIELEPVLEGAAAYGDLADRAVADLFNPDSVEMLYQRAVDVVRTATGFDRVMLYRFDARYNGQVLAEARREGIGSFLGLFFPSSDIGGPVRELYLKNFTRYIPDIGGETYPLAGIYPGGGCANSVYPVDMTHTNLRSVAPCHVTYLRNMGVGASMSFSINIDDRLWGLFACHHYAPRTVSFDQRVVCEQTAMMFIYKLHAMSSTAARLAQREATVKRIAAQVTACVELGRRVAQAERTLGVAPEVAKPLVARLLAAVHEQTHFLAALEGQDPGAGDVASGTVPTPAQQDLLDIVEADSAAVVRNGRVWRIGDAPPAMSILAIANMFGRELPDLRGGNVPVFGTDCLSAVVPAADSIKDRAAGVLAASLNDEAQALILWFRREQIVHATWAGDPRADAISKSTGTFNPRASFAAWKEDIRNLSRPWVHEDAETAFDLAQAIRAAEGRALSPEPHAQAAAGYTAAPATARVVPMPLSPPGQAAADAAGRPRRVIRIGQV
jgi:light-regulated signal transduction histidine kinase (bacteriophytochrome)